MQEATAVASLDWSCEAEVGDLGIEVLIKQDILGLQVSVSDSTAV